MHLTIGDTSQIKDITSSLLRTSSIDLACNNNGVAIWNSWGSGRQIRTQEDLLPGRVNAFVAC